MNNRLSKCSRFITIFAVWMITSVVQGAGQEARQIDPQKSTLTVRVYKSGLFSAFAHDHEIKGSITQGSFSESKRTVELAVDARTLKVVDADVSDKDRAEIQETMLGPKVLDSQKFPEIQYRASKIERLSGDKWVIQGDLTLHGQTRPVKVEVEGQNGRYRGSSTISQKEFGIEPVRVAGGTVKVKNEVRIEFEIVGR